jgi:hypothetical protein
MFVADVGEVRMVFLFTLEAVYRGGNVPVPTMVHLAS